MKVLIVCSGNVEDFNIEKHHAFIFEQVNAIKKKHHDVDFDYFYFKGKGISGYLSNLRKFKKRLHHGEYDFVHAHYALSSLLANLQLKVPVITTFHGSDINFWHLNILSSVVNFLSWQSIFVSENLKQKIIFKKRDSAMHTIPCGVDLTRFYPVDKHVALDYFNLSPDKKYILFSSSFSSKVKNYPLALKAVKLLNNSSVELLELKNYNREEVNMLFNSSDVALMTSYSEGSPQFIKEAMAVNCPIVSTDVGDVKEIIQDTDGCYITSYNPKDIAEKISKALRFGIKTPGRKKILHLDNERIAEEVYNIYLSSTKS